MRQWIRVGGTGTPVGGVSGGGNNPPGDASILNVFVVDTTPDADGGPQKRITVTYQAPDPLGTFAGVWIYLDAPDTAGALTLADGTVPADGTHPEGGIFEPALIGFFPYDAQSPQATFNYKASPDIQNWRVYLVSGSGRAQSKPVQAGETGESPSHQFVALPPSGPTSGREYAPLVREVALADLGWETNPEQITGESGDQSWRVAIEWEWPSDDQNYQAFGGVNIVLSDGATQVYIGNVDKGAPPLWISAPQILKPGTIDYTVFLISYDVRATNNTLVSGITPSIEFSVTRQLGPTGQEYASVVTPDGVHNLVTAVPVSGADGTSLLRVTGYWTPPSDPQFGGAEIVARKPDGNYYKVAAGRISPIEADISQPASVQSWRFYVRSVDVNGRRNSISDAVTPYIDISVGNANGQLNLGKALTSSFSSEFKVESGAFRINQLSANSVITGILQVGGGGGKVSIMKVFDTLGSLIGWVGDDTGSSGYVGGWFKQLRIGGGSPASAKITADASGNVTISTSLIVGTLPSGQVGSGYPASSIGSGALPVGVIYAGTINANQVNAGTFTGLAMILNANGIISSLNSLNDGGFGYYGVSVSNVADWLSTRVFPVGLFIRNPIGTYVVQLRGDNYDGVGYSGVLSLLDEYGTSAVRLDGRPAPNGGITVYNRQVGAYEFRIQSLLVINSLRQFVGSGVDVASGGISGGGYNVYGGYIGQTKNVVGSFTIDGLPYTTLIFRGGIFVSYA